MILFLPVKPKVYGAFFPGAPVVSAPTATTDWPRFQVPALLGKSQCLCHQAEGMTERLASLAVQEKIVSLINKVMGSDVIWKCLSGIVLKVRFNRPNSYLKYIFSNNLNLSWVFLKSTSLLTDQELNAGLIQKYSLRIFLNHVMPAVGLLCHHSPLLLLRFYHSVV